MDNTRSHARFVPPALAVAVVAVSFAAIFFRQAAPTHPLVAAGVRLAVASLLLAPWTIRALVRGRLRGPIGPAAVLAGVFYGVHFGTWVTSLTLTSIAVSVTLVTTTPLLLALAAVVTGRDRPGKRLWMALGLGGVGLLIVGGGDLGLGADRLIGDALALVGAAAMAGYLLTSRRLGRRLDLWAFSGIATGVGAVLLLGTAVVAGVPLRVPTWEAGLYLVLAALVPQLIGHTLMTWTLRFTRPIVVGLAVLGEPVGATILGALWLGEAVTGVVGVGCAVTLAAVGLAVASHRAEPVG